MIHPLAGKRIVITRPEAQAGEFIDMLREAGAVPIIFPTIQIAPIPNNIKLDNALHHLCDYDWVIFTSVNGVSMALDRMRELGLPLADLVGCKIAVIGPATAAKLREYGLIPALQPDEYVAEAIIGALIAHDSGVAERNFLLLRADIARATLREDLLSYGAFVDEIPVYQTVCGEPTPAAYAELRAGGDAITFTSSSTVRYFFSLLGDESRIITERAMIACIGPITAKTAREYGLTVHLVAEEYTVPGLLAALTENIR
jgi:uroporphyrinogen-III synthase